MTRLEKLIERLRARPPELDHQEVAAILQAFGWTMTRQRGSHVSYTKKGERTISIPLRSGRKVRRAYLDLICKQLRLDDEE